MTTTAENNQKNDIYVASLYIARSEGKQIQEPVISDKAGSCWADTCINQALGIQHRIKPQTLLEAVNSNSTGSYPSDMKFYWAVFGAEWQKKQDEQG